MKVTIELEDAGPAKVAADETLAHVKLLTDNCANLIWLTGGHRRPGHGHRVGAQHPSLHSLAVEVDIHSSSTQASVDRPARRRETRCPTLSSCWRMALHTSAALP